MIRIIRQHLLLYCCLFVLFAFFLVVLFVDFCKLVHHCFMLSFLVILSSAVSCKQFCSLHFFVFVAFVYIFNVKRCKSQTPVSRLFIFIFICWICKRGKDKDSKQSQTPTFYWVLQCSCVNHTFFMVDSWIVYLSMYRMSTSNLEYEECECVQVSESMIRISDTYIIVHYNPLVRITIQFAQSFCQKTVERKSSIFFSYFVLMPGLIPKLPRYDPYTQKIARKLVRSNKVMWG